MILRKPGVRFCCFGSVGSVCYDFSRSWEPIVLFFCGSVCLMWEKHSCLLVRGVLWQRSSFCTEITPEVCTKLGDVNEFVRWMLLRFRTSRVRYTLFFLCYAISQLECPTLCITNPWNFQQYCRSQSPPFCTPSLCCTPSRSLAPSSIQHLHSAPLWPQPLQAQAHHLSSPSQPPVHLHPPAQQTHHSRPLHHTQHQAPQSQYPQESHTAASTSSKRPYCHATASH